VSLEVSTCEVALFINIKGKTIVHDFIIALSKEIINSGVHSMLYRDVFSTVS